MLLAPNYIGAVLPCVGGAPNKPPADAIPYVKPPPGALAPNYDEPPNYPAPKVFYC